MQLTRSQGQRLVQILKLMRPDWASNPIDKLLSDANQSTGLPGHDYDHALRAAAHYATQPNQAGGYAKRTPNMFVATGAHWDNTAPANSRHQKHVGAPCEDHAGQDADTCRSCRADILLGDRKPEQQGKRLHAGKRTPAPDGWRNKTNESTQ